MVNDPFSTPIYIQPKRRRRLWVELLLAAGFLFCLLLGVGALVAFWSLYHTQTTTTLATDPLETLQADRVMPQLALMNLGGDPVEALAYQAMHANQLETSRALVLFTIPVSGAARMGLYLQLAQRFAQTEQPLAAAQLFRLARAIAILDSTIPPLARSQALVQCAAGLLAAGEQAAALDTAIQAKRVAEQAPGLLPIQRGQIFDNLQPLARQLNDPKLLQQIVEFARNPYLTPPGLMITQTLAVWGEAPPLDPNITTALATRQQRARELAARIGFTNGTDIDPEREALAQALRAEDQSRSEFLKQKLLPDLPVMQRLWLRQDQRAWLLLKASIAQKGFGLSIVPEWEADRTAILSELNLTTAELIRLFDEMIQAEASPTAKDMLTVQLWQWLALQSELGLYPNSKPTELDLRLREAETRLEQAGKALAMRIAFSTDGSPPGFRIQAPPGQP